MNKCLERVYDRHFLESWSLRLRNDTNMLPQLKSLFFIVTPIVYDLSPPITIIPREAERLQSIRVERVVSVRQAVRRRGDDEDEAGDEAAAAGRATLPGTGGEAAVPQLRRMSDSAAPLLQLGTSLNDTDAHTPTRRWMSITEI
jgi:hypothetical protein